MITFLKGSIVTALGGDFMRNTNKSISRTILPCIATETSKRNRNVSDIINGTSAVISEPEGKLCPFDR